mgnify:CR=1 FL=1
MNTTFKLLSGALALALAGQAQAGTTNWLLTSAAVSSNAYVTSAGGTSVTATGWANTAGTTGSQNGGNTTPLEQQKATADINGNLTGNLRLYSGGLGINNLDGCANASGTCDVGDTASTAPEHALDNNQRYEMVLLSFSKSVQLTNAKFGWTGTSDCTGSNCRTPGSAETLSTWDSDYTVLAYTGSGAPSFAGLTWATLGSDWTVIGSYANATDGTNNAINSAGKYSSYWLIGAYNPLADTTTTGLLAGNDYLKLASVTGNVCTTGTGPNCGSGGNVPEPGSLALFAGAMMGLVGLRRRKAS